MKTEIRLRNIPDAKLRAYTQRQLLFHLSRFAASIEEAIVRVSDENGPKDGVDKRCQVLVHLKRGGPVTVSLNSSDARAAVDGAIERAVRTIARELSRVRAWGATG